MTTTYLPQDDDWYAGDWQDEEEAYYGYAPAQPAIPVDVVTLAAVALIILALVFGLSRLVVSRPIVIEAPAPPSEARVEPEEPQLAPALPTGAEGFIMPYDEYVLTQGPHGMSYGHYALDMASGAGEPILSPINGVVSQLFVDGIGNPTLVLENDVYAVTMLHGDYSAVVGQEVQIGEPVGVESNKGNTRDMAGNSCRNRDCGYHTHLNVYDKRIASNVNPLDLLN